MADEIRKVLNLSLGESPKNVRELKQDINELKTAIGDMVVAGQTGTTAYDNAVKLLGEDLRTLNTVQNATKKEVDALDGSYNALVQKMRELKAEWRATNDEARRGELGNQINTINDQLKALDYSIGNFQRNVGNYGNAWESLGKSVNVAQQAGSQFTNGLIAMGSVMNLTTAEEKAMNAQLGVMQKGFAALNAARGILGAVNAMKAKAAATKAARTEEIAEAAAVKAQTVAQTQYTVATNTATVAQEGFNTAVKANPIGAVISVIVAAVAAIGALVTVLLKSHSAMKQYESQLNSLKSAEEKLNEKIEENNTLYSNREKIWRAMGIEGRQLIELQRTQLKQNLTLAKSHLAVAEAEEERYLQELRLETRSGLWIALHRGRINVMKEFEEKTNSARKTVEELEIAISNLSYDAMAADIKDATDAQNKAQQAADEAQKKLVKTAEDGQKEITEITKAGYTEREKVTAEYQEKLHRLVEGRDAEVAIAKAAGLPTKDIFDKYNKAALQLYDQYLKNLDGVYKNEFLKFSGSKKEQLKYYQEWIKDMSNMGKKAAVTMGFDPFGILGFQNGNEDIAALRSALKQYSDQIVGYLLRFKDVLGNELENANVDDLLAEFLFDASSFEQRYGEPLAVAMKEYFATVQELEEEGYKIIGNTVEAKTSAIWDLIRQGNIEGAEKAINELENFITASTTIFSGSRAQMETVKEAGRKTAKALKEAFYLEMAQTPELDQKTALGFLEKWYELAQTGEFGEMFDVITTKYNRMVAEIKASHLDKVLVKPLDSVANMLDNVAQAWENTIRAQVEAGEISEEQAKKSFETMKALQYGAAVINTAAAVVQALADPTVPDFYLRAINAAAALAAGIAQIAQISATHYGSSGSKSTSTPTLVDRSPVTQTVSLNASEVGESATQNMRVYVVESDITDAQNRTKARVSESTF